MASKHSFMFKQQQKTAYMFLLPALLLLFVFAVLPVFLSLYLSFTRYDVFTPPRWIGFSNYIDILLYDSYFWISVKNTACYAVGTIPIGMALSLILAILLNQKIRGVAFFRAAYYTPVVTSMVVVSMVWLWIYEPQYGLLNSVLEMLGISGPAWLGDPKWAMPSIIIASIWKNLGYNMTIYLAGLQGIPEYLYEAALIDGASAWQRFWKITLPLLKPITFFIFVMACIGSFQVFSQVYIMTAGGPADATTTIVHQIYQNGFQFMKMGYAAAMSFLLFVLLFVISVVNMRLFSGSPEY